MSQLRNLLTNKVFKSQKPGASRRLFYRGLRVAAGLERAQDKDKSKR